MTLASLQYDLIILGIFLIIGFVIRELIKPLQKLFIPASVIGGIVALLVGSQVLGLIELPSSFSEFPGTLIDLIMTGVVFGITLNLKKVRSYLDYTAVMLGVFGMQTAVGIALGAALMALWPTMPQGWGSMGAFAFFGGHGTAGAAGAVFEDLGVSGNLGIGMILATFGMIVAIVVGMIIINIGVRKGWTTHVQSTSSRPAWFYGGSLPENEQKSIGVEKVTAISINSIALQLSILLLAVFIGKQLFAGLAILFPFFDTLPSLLHGIIGALILWPIMVLFKLDRYVDLRTISTITGFALELVILTAIATVEVSLVTSFIVPLLIYMIIMVAMTISITLYFSKKFCSTEWFEKAVMIFGAGTGNTSTGLALVRAVDPESKSTAVDAHGIYNALTVWTNVFPALIPTLLMTGMGAPIGISLAIGIGSLLLGWIFFARKGTN